MKYFGISSSRRLFVGLKFAPPLRLDIRIMLSEMCDGLFMEFQECISSAISNIRIG